MKIVKVGIIGLGRSGRDIHGATIAAHPGFRTVAATDPLRERRTRAESEWGCDTYAHHRSLLHRNDLDLIVVANPSRLHVPVSLLFLEAGFNVLCEKPLARKVSEVDRIIRAARKSGTLMTVFQNRRYDPFFPQVRNVLESGVLGRIVMIKVQANGFSRRWDWQTLRREYGGNMMNNGSHFLDQALQLFGTDVMPKVTCAMDRTNTYGDAEDHVKLILTAPGKPMVDLEQSNCCAYGESKYNVYGTRGGLIATDNSVQWKYYVPSRQKKHSLSRKPIVDRNGLPTYCYDDIRWHEKSWTRPERLKSANMQYYDMLHGVLTRGRKPLVTLDEVRRQVQIIEEAYRQNPVARMPGADMQR